MSVDFPDPETPVMHTSSPTGNSSVTFFKLLPRAPLMTKRCLPPAVLPRRLGSAMDFPDKYCPVKDSEARLISAGRPFGNHYLSAMLACAWAHVHHIVGGVDRFFVVFDNDDRIAQIAQPFQRFEQTVVVALVQADRRLVHDVHYSGQPRPDLRGQADTLGFSPESVLAERTRKGNQGRRCSGTIRAQKSL